MTDTVIAAIARNLGEALMDYAYSRKDEDKVRVLQLQYELCNACKAEELQKESEK